MAESFEGLVIVYLLGLGAPTPDECFVNTQKMDGGQFCFRVLRPSAQLTIVSDSTPISAHDPRARLTSIRTQRSHWGAQRRERGQIDLELAFGDRIVAVEIKIDAREGVTASGARQLESYCRKSSIQQVAMISGSLQRGDFHSLGKKYLRPDRGYFLWSDVYPLLAAGAKRKTAAPLHRGALGLFRHLNFEPHHPAVGDLDDAVANIRFSNRNRFRDYWSETVKRLDALGAGPEAPRSNGELYTYERRRRAYKIWFDPRFVPGSLRVRFWTAPRDLDRTMAAVQSAAPSQHVLLSLPQKARWPAFDLRIPYSILFGGRATPDQCRFRLAHFVAPIVEAAG